jgi:hypothetical protein
MDKKIKLDIINKILTEDVSLRKANAKIYPLGKGKYHAAISLGEIHYKDNYSDNTEPWKDIDLTWNGNRIDKAPYILERDGNIYTVTDKRTGLQSVIELTDVGSKKIKKTDVTDKKLTDLAPDIDFEIIPQNHQIRFQRTLKTASAAKDAKFKITGDIPIKYQAYDADGNAVELETAIKDGVLTETVKEKTGLKYPIKVDPTVEPTLDASANDCVFRWNGSNWTLPSLTVAFVRVGYNSSIALKEGGGFRWTGCPPQGAQIDTAYITLTDVYGIKETTVNARITGNKQASPDAWSNTANYQARRGTVVGGANNDYITTAQVDWDNITGISEDQTWNTPEIKTVIQELINQAGYSGTIALWIDDHDARGDQENVHVRYFYSWDGDPAKAPVLHIEYTVVIETNACTNVTDESATANAEIIIADNTVIRRGFVYTKGNTGSPLITDLNAIVISEETKSGIDGLVLRKYNGDLEENGYFTFDDIIDLGAVYTVRAHGILTTTSLNLYDDLYSYTDLYAVFNLFGIQEGKTSVVIEISTTDDDTAADPEWSDWQTFVIGDYSARGFRFRIYAEGLPPDITPILYSVYIELDMEDRVYSFEETVTEGGITIEFDPPFYAAPHIGISILDAQSGDYYVIDTKDENGFNVEIFNGVSSVERAISGIARGYGMKEV